MDGAFAKTPLNLAPKSPKGDFEKIILHFQFLI